MDPVTITHGEEQSPTEMTKKKEVEEAAQSSAYVEIEIDVNHLKQEPGVVQSVISEPMLLLREKILYNSNKGTGEQQAVRAVSTHAISRKNVASGSIEQGQLHIKEEPEDTDLDIGPTVVQHLDSHYRTDQAELGEVKQESTSLGPKEVMPRIYNSQVVSCQIRDEAIENSSKDNAALTQCSSTLSTKGIMQSQIYTCDVCKKTFKTAAGMRSHVNRVHGKSFLKCPECSKHFRCKEYLNGHIVNVHGHQRQQKCEICGKVFKRMKFLKNHMKFVHGVNTTDSSSLLYTCDYCLKKFHWKHSLVSHLKNMHANKSYTCEVCNINFESQLYLSVHTEQELGEKDKYRRYKCDKCLKVFKSKTYLWRHSKRVHGTGSHKCTECYKEFKCRAYLSRHVQYTHSEEQFECDICYKTCKSKIALQNHVSCFHRHRLKGSHKQQMVGMNDSDVCHMLQSPKLKVHNYRLKSICTVQLSRLHMFQCELCDEVYTENRWLLQHLQSVHETRSQTSLLKICKINEQRSAGAKDSNYRCDKCTKIFQTKIILRKHCKHVRGTERYKCAECNKEYKNKSYLRSHVVCVHSEQQYKCDICKKMFKSKTSLSTHTVRLHNHWFPGSHKCTECHKEFKCKAYLVRHVRDVHGECLPGTDVI